ncbi:MAG: disulfide isomerase DsbC N-terminal domain-containing protein [Thermodesulfovibrionales bacterium]|jgi:thiol:disulfide interchange protein DsbC
MRKIVLFVAVAFFLLPVSYSHGFSEKGQDCSKCHTLSKEEASALLKKLDPNIQVLEVTASPLKSMWEVDIETGGKKGLTYIDFSKTHIISGSIFAINEKKNLTKERFDQINKVDASKIPLDDALVMGAKDAKYKVIVFSDPE